MARMLATTRLKSSKANASSSTGISRQEAPNLRTRSPGLARIPAAAALESFRACSRPSLSLSHSASLEQKRITFSGKQRESDGDAAAAAISVLLLFPLREGKYTIHANFWVKLLSLPEFCRCGKGESDSDRMESRPMGVARARRAGIRMIGEMGCGSKEKGLSG